MLSNASNSAGDIDICQPVTGNITLYRKSKKLLSLPMRITGMRLCIWVHVILCVSSIANNFIITHADFGHGHIIFLLEREMYCILMVAST